MTGTITGTRASVNTGAAGGGGSLAGVGTLLRFNLRRDRIRMPVWILIIVGFTASGSSAFPEIYASAADRQARAELMNNPAAQMFTGPGYGLDNYTFGAMMAHEFFFFMALVVAFMSVLFMVRHTRTEEETGRTELLRATVVGRHAGLTAALIVVAGLNLVIGALLALTLPAILDGLSVPGSLAYGLGTAMVGLVFAGITALAAQLTEYSRGASGIGVATVFVSWALLVLGNLGDDTASWLSPFGWALHTRMYVDERWWPLLISAAVFLLVTAAAYVLSARRDVGAGLWPSRPGPANASANLSGPFGLAMRLQRASFIGWAAGIAVFGLAFGTMITEVESFLAENDAVAEAFALGDAGLTEQFVAMLLALTAMAVVGFAIAAALRSRSEETTGRAEPVLAAAVGRTRWAVSNLAIAVVGGAALLVLTGLTFGISAALVTEDASWIPELLVAGLVHAPALWLVIGIAVALYGLVPKATAAVWVVLAYALTVTMLGGFLQFPDWMYDLSPFEHTPAMPAEDFAATPLIILTLGAAALMAVGLAALRRRDLYTI